MQVRPKVLVAPAEDPSLDHIRKLEDVPASELVAINHFFERL